MSQSSSQLQLSPEGTKGCVEACNKYIDELDLVKRTAKALVRAEAFGTLPSGQALGKKFFELASGGGQSFEQVIQQHIDVIQRLREAFVQAGAGYQATEDSNTVLLNSPIK